MTIQPVMFVLMFAYVFGGAIGLPGGGNYHAYLIGGMLGMSLAQTAPGTAVAVVSDMSTGLIDRFRSLPMSRAAVLTARTIADLLTQMIGAAVVALRRARDRLAGAHRPRRRRSRRSRSPCCSATRSPGPASASAWCCAARRPRSRPDSLFSCR